MTNLRNLVVDVGHSVIYVGQSVIDVGHPIIYGKHLFRNPPYPLVYSMRRPQVFRNNHPSFLMRKLVQSLYRVFHIGPPDQPLPILFWTFFSHGRHTLAILLTDSALLHLLGRNPENCENFHHYLNVRIDHFRGR